MAFGDYINNGTTVDSASALSHNLAFPSNVTTGNSLIVVARTASGDVTGSCSDSLGNTYATDALQFHSTDNHKLWVFRASNITGGANTVTVTFGSAVSCRLIIDEYGGNFALHGTPAKATGLSGTSLDSGSQTTTVTCALVGALAVAGDLNNGTATAGAGWTKRRTVTVAGPHWKSMNEDRAGTVAAGTYNATGTTDVAEHWTAILCAYSDAGGATSVQKMTRSFNAIPFYPKPTIMRY